jgi:hypothetical protein
MATVDRLVPVPRDTVAALLADPRSYDGIVVGSKRIRWFDARWPDSGTSFHHSIGFAVLHIRDATTVVADELPERLRLATGLGPLGAAEVTYTLEDEDGGTRVEMTEHATSGILGRLWSPPLDAAMAVRNRVALRRLEDLAVDRDRIRRRAEEPVPATGRTG